MSTKKLFCWFVPVGSLVLLALFFFSLVGYDFSAFVCLGIAAVILTYFLLLRFPGRISLWLRRILTVCLILGILLAAITGILIGSAATGGQEEACDYIIVLGAAVHGNIPSLSLRERLDAAYEYLQEHPRTVCVASGGQGNGENITEALCMYNYLTAKGIDPDRIWQEDRATSTQENISLSLDLIEEKTGIRPSTAGIVSSEYHLYRAGLLAKAQDLQPVGIPATTTWLSLRINYFLREIVAVWYYTLLAG